jgi:hypothetical protein
MRLVGIAREPYESLNEAFSPITSSRSPISVHSFSVDHSESFVQIDKENRYFFLIFILSRCYGIPKTTDLDRLWFVRPASEFPAFTMWYWTNVSGALRMLCRKSRREPGTKCEFIKFALLHRESGCIIEKTRALA